MTQTGNNLAWLTPAELAARWRTTDDTILREIHAKRLPALQVGRQYRVKLSVVESMERNAEHQQAVKVIRSSRKFQMAGVDHLAE